ncbi:MAG TPA: HAMP domain-containing sensor histidine kinase [Gemmatimonadaceae bacterium]|nr:HAMP domain-containing sensor histidine kinase [Gemmatimonadaceae bacterium]
MNANLAVASPAPRASRPALRAPARRQPRDTSNDLDLVVQLAHDLRSPLSGILMLAESLREGVGGSVTESQRRLLDLIHGAALSLCTSASDVVELALDGQACADETPAEFAVSDVLDAVRDMAAPLAEGKNLELRIVEPAHDRHVGRARALTRVLLNLTTNALKVTERGVVEIAVMEVDGDLDRLEFSVRDSGPGLEATAAQPANAGPGRCLTSAGLGLRICRRMMLQLCSSLQCESSPNDGTRFHFEVYAPSV